MKLVYRILGLGASVGAIAVSSSVACNQPPPKCSIGHGVFGVKMDLVSQTGDAMLGCGDITAEIVGASSYNDMKADGYPDLDHASIALQPLTMGRARAVGEDALDGQGDSAPITDTAHEIFALGKFDASEPVGDLCIVPTLTVGELNLAEIPAQPDDPKTKDDESKPAIPALDRKWQWSNVRVLMRPDALGTQFTADVTVSINNCVAVYKAQGVYMSDNIGAGGGQKGVDCTAADGTSPDQTLCTPDAPNPDSGLPAIGSGISPNTAIQCIPLKVPTDPSSGEAANDAVTTAAVCGPAKAFPSFN